MFQKDSPPFSLANGSTVENTQGHPDGKTGEASDTVSPFPVTGDVTYKPVEKAPERRARRLPGRMARIVSAVGLGAALLVPLASCSSSDDCYSSANSSSGASPVRYTTSTGIVYVWLPGHGGWANSGNENEAQTRTLSHDTKDGKTGVGSGQQYDCDSSGG